VEFLVLIVVGIIIWKVFGDSSDVSTSTPARGSVRTGGAARESSSDTGYSAKLEPVAGENGEIIPGLLLLWVRGRLKAPDSTPAAIRATIYDSEAGPEKPVATHSKEQQANDSPVYCAVRLVQYSYDNRIIHPDWTSTGIPVILDSLIGPRGGSRKMFLLVEVVQADGYEIWRGEVPFTVNLDFGYEDRDERFATNLALSVQLAVAVAASNEGIHENELAAIKAWIKTNTEEIAAEERSERRKSLVATLRTAQQRAIAGTLQISKLIAKLKLEGTRSGRMMAVELCYTVMAADGVASADELETVNKIAEKLDVNAQLLSAARDKSLAGLSGGAVGSRDRYALLGIDKNAPPEETRAQLSALYKKWSSRATTLTDPAKRKEAEDMLRLIAEIRAEH
jgi:uncharacterized tellurite resistance protein B-like protein